MNDNIKFPKKPYLIGPQIASTIKTTQSTDPVISDKVGNVQSYLDYLSSSMKGDDYELSVMILNEINRAKDSEAILSGEIDNVHDQLTSLIDNISDQLSNIIDAISDTLSTVISTRFNELNEKIDYNLSTVTSMIGVHDKDELIEKLSTSRFLNSSNSITSALVDVDEFLSELSDAVEYINDLSAGTYISGNKIAEDLLALDKALHSTDKNLSANYKEITTYLTKLENDLDLIDDEISNQINPVLREISGFVKIRVHDLYTRTDSISTELSVFKSETRNSIHDIVINLTGLSTEFIDFRNNVDSSLETISSNLSGLSSEFIEFKEETNKSIDLLNDIVNDLGQEISELSDNIDDVSLDLSTFKIKTNESIASLYSDVDAISGELSAYEIKTDKSINELSTYITALNSDLISINDEISDNINPTLREISGLVKTRVHDLYTRTDSISICLSTLNTEFVNFKEETSDTISDITSYIIDLENDLDHIDDEISDNINPTLREISGLTKTRVNDLYKRTDSISTGLISKKKQINQ